jgi:hypothetical protein
MDYKYLYYKYKNKYNLLKGGTFINRNFLEEDFYIPLKTYPLNINKIPEYKDTLTKNGVPQDQITLFEKILRLTTHVTFNDLIRALKICISNFESNIGDRPFILYIMAPDGYSDITYKSNYWIAKIIYILLNRKPTKIITRRNNLSDTDIEDILTCDDSMYSGTQMIENLEKMFNNLQSNDNLENRKLHIICPLMSHLSTQSLLEVLQINLPSTEKYKRFFIYSQIYFHSLEELLTSEEYNMFENDMRSGEAYAYPIYLDHRVADNVSSLPFLYILGKIALNNKQIPLYLGSLLKNCEDMTINRSHIYSSVNDQWNSKCPPVPYKLLTFNDIKNMRISVYDFERIYKSDFYPFLDYTNNNMLEPNQYIEFIPHANVNTEELKEYLINKLNGSQSRGNDYEILIPVDINSLNYAQVYIKGNMTLNNKDIILNHIERIYYQYAISYLPIILQQDGELVIGFSTYGNIPYLSEEMVKIIRKTYSQFIKETIGAL